MMCVMRNLVLPLLLAGVLSAGPVVAQSTPPLEFVPLFNGKDLSGWRNINTAPETWSVRDGMIVTSGEPMGVLCTTKQYENFVFVLEWRHTQPGGNSGVFMWSDAVPQEGSVYPNGLEVQILELDWPKLNTRNGVTPPEAYVHGELFGVGSMKITPDNPRGARSKSIENRALGRGHWNTYHIVAVDGVVKLAVNGKFVNGISQASHRKGYLCLESEGAETHFRNLRMLELPPGVITPEQTQPLLPEDRR
jgi:hypothetical protein